MQLSLRARSRALSTIFAKLGLHCYFLGEEAENRCQWHLIYGAVSI